MRSRRQTRLRHKYQRRRSLFESLESRQLLAVDVFVLDADPAEKHGAPRVEQFQLGNDWTTAANHSTPVAQGEPIRLTWSIVPDGTPIDGFSGEAAAPSNLVSFLNSVQDTAGSVATANQPWFSLFQQVFHSWDEISGVDFVYEPNDDGAPLGDTMPGQPGVRGDIRLGGHAIDGNRNTLAYSFFPDHGDLVIDTLDTAFYGDRTNNSINLRNTIAHELGHGLGLEHVTPVDASKLMEPAFTDAFDGPQFDDRLAIQRLYGDQFEPNEDVAGATELGSLTGPLTVDKVSIDDDSDIDVYRFSIAAAETIRVAADPIGPTFLSGSETGTVSSFNARLQSNLSLEVLAGDGSVLATAASQPVGQSESISNLTLSSPGTYYVRVTGADDSVQAYGLSILTAPVISQLNDIEIAGRVVHDRDRDNIDQDDPTLEGFTVFLDENQNGQLDPTELFRTTTDSAGAYRFTSVPAGDYVITQDLPDGWEQTHPFDPDLSDSNAAIISAGANINRAVAVDINHDGHLDIAVTRNDQRVELFMNDGSGGFTSSGTVVVGRDPTAIVAADFDGDGRDDDLLVENRSQGSASVLTNDDAGSFTCGTAQCFDVFSGGVSPTDVAAGDFNGDGFDDVVVGHAQGKVLIYLNAGDGTFNQTTPSQTVMSNLNTSVTQSAIATGDYDGDTDLDLIVVNSNSQTVMLIPGLQAQGGTVPFGAATPISLGKTPTDVRLVDVNADGRQDIVTSNGATSEAGTVAVLINNGSGFDAPVFYQGDSTGVVAGDFDRDGDVDLATGNNYLRGDGDGTFEFKSFSAGNQSVASADLDGDGRPDLIKTNLSSTFKVLLNPGPYHVSVVATDSLSGFDFGNATIDSNPVVSIGDFSLAEGNSGTTTFQIPVTLDGPAPAGGAIIGFATGDDTASSGADYISRTGTVVIPSGQSSGTIDVQVQGDGTFEPDETFFVELTSSTGAAIDGEQISSVTILNDDVPTLSIDDVAQAETDSGTTSFVFTVTLSQPKTTPVTVDFTTANGTAHDENGNNDYRSSSGTLTFGAGETTKTIAIDVVGDEDIEPHETFLVRLSNPSGADLAAQDTGTGTIENDDVPEIVIADVAFNEGDVGSRSVTITVNLSAPSIGAATVDYATADGTATVGSDYSAASGTLTFPIGVTQQTFTIDLTGDTTLEADETLFVLLSNPVGATMPDDRGVVTIENDDFPAISVNDVTLAEGDAGSTPFTFTVSLSESPVVPVTVDFATFDATATIADSDYASRSGTLTFNPGVVSLDVVIQVSGDTVFESDQTFDLVLANAMGAAILDGTGTGTIVNDEDTMISIGDVARAEGDSGTTAFDFTVRLSDPVGSPVRVDFATGAIGTGPIATGADFQSNSGTLVIPAGETTGTITVLINGDTDIELDETFRVSLSNAIGAAIDDGEAIGTIENDDQPVVSIDNPTILEGDSGTQTLQFTVRLDRPGLLPVAVAFATQDGSATTADADYVATSGTMTFNPSQTTHTIDVVINGDLAVEDDEQFVVELSGVTGATLAGSRGTGTITNDDDPAVSIADASQLEGNSGNTAFAFDVTLSSPAFSDIDIAYATTGGSAAAGSDFTATSGTLTIPAGQTSGTIVVNVAGDTTVERDESFVVDLTSASGATIVDAQATGTIENDDDVVLSIDDVSTVEGNAGAAQLIFTVSLSQAGVDPITLDFSTSDGATSGAATSGSGDYVPHTGSLTFAAGETSKTIVVLVNGDTEIEDHETLLVRLTNVVGAVVGDGQGEGTISNDDEPTISIDDVSRSEGDSGNSVYNFTVSLSAAGFFPITADFATVDGTATSADYAGRTGSITFNPMQTTQTISIDVAGETVIENDENFFVDLSNIQGALAGDVRGEGTIENDDSPAVSISDATIVEGDSGTKTLTFTATLSAAGLVPLTVDFGTADGTANAGTDFVANAGTLTFNPGDVSQTIVVTILGETAIEIDETFTVDLSGVTGGTIADGVGQGTIENDDLPVMTIADISLNEGNSGSTPFVFTVSLDRPSVVPVTVSYATSAASAGATDFTATSGQLTFPAGSTSQTITVNVTGETDFEPDEQFQVNLSGISDATPGDTSATATIVNDDLSKLTITDVTQFEGQSGTTPFTFTVTLSHPVSSPVTVDFTTLDGTATSGDSDFTAASGTITFNSNQTTQTITIDVIGDTKIESNESFTVSLTGSSGGEIVDGQGLGTIRNDDLPGISVNDVSIVEGDSGTQQLEFIVSLSAAHVEPVTVRYATQDSGASSGSDYASTSGTLNFAVGETAKTVRVTVNGDTLIESDENLFLNLTAPTKAALLDARGVGTIVNDDLPVITFADVSQSETHSGQRAFTFTVQLSDAFASPVTVDYATLDNTATIANNDYQSASGTLTFNSGETVKTITVLVNGDSTIESHETFFVDLTSPSNATIGDVRAIGTIRNDDFPLTTFANRSVSEGDSGSTTLTFELVLSAPSPDTITVDFATTDGSATAGVDYTAATGTLTFDPDETSKFIHVQVTGDTINESHETLFVDLTNPTGTTFPDTRATGTILNDDGPPEIRINNPTLVEGDSGISNMVFTVTLHEPSGLPVTVDYATRSDAAIAGDDFISTTGTLTIDPGDTSATVSVPIIGETAIEPNERFFLDLSSPTSSVLRDSRGDGTIINDDSPDIFVRDVTVLEGDSGTANFAFTIELSEPGFFDVTADFATADGTATLADGDYQPNSGSLTIPAGSRSTTVFVLGNGDPTIEADESFFLNLTNVSQAVVADGQGRGTIGNDDHPDISVADLTQAEGSSGTTTFTFSLNLSAPSFSPVTVDVSTVDGTAENQHGNNDYQQLSSQTVTIPAGVTTGTFDVTVRGDSRIEPNETFLVNLSNANNAVLDDSQAVGTIVNDDFPSLSIDDRTVTEGDSGSTTTTFTVTLSEPFALPVTVRYATDRDSAAAGEDFLAIVGLLSFAPNETVKTITATVFGDTLVEPDESFFINLFDPTNATLADSQGLGRILADDFPDISIADATITEGDSGTQTLSFPVTLAEASPVATSINYTAANDSATTADSDYQTASGTLNIPAGSTGATISVTVFGDTNIELDEQFFVRLSNASSGAITDDEAVGTITNDDAPVVSIGDAAVDEGDTGTRTLTFTISLDAAGLDPLTVDVATGDATATTGDGDYTASSTTLTFSPGETTKTFVVDVNGDAQLEDDESLTVTLSGVTGGSIGDGVGTGTIRNDDFPEISIANVSEPEETGTSHGMVFTVVLSAAHVVPVQVEFATGDDAARSGVDFQAVAGRLTFSAGQTSRTITVPIVTDDVYEPDESFFVNLSSASQATIGVSRATGTIENDDLPDLGIDDVSRGEGDSGTTDFNFTVTLSVASSDPVTVDYATTTGTATATDFTAVTGTLTFAPGETSKTITVPVIGDGLVESVERFVVNLSNPTNADLVDSDGEGTILNDDSFSLSIDDVAQLEGDSGTTTFQFTVSLSQPRTIDVSVDFATADGTANAGEGDYAAASGSVTIPAGATSQTIDVVVNGDTNVEASETFFVNLSNASGATLLVATGTGTIVSDEFPTLSIDDVSQPEGNSGPTQFLFTVSLSSPAAQVTRVQYTTVDDSAEDENGNRDYQAVGSTLTFNPGEQTKTIAVGVNGDLTPEANESFFVELSNPEGATITDARGVGTIQDDDSQLDVLVEFADASGNLITTIDVAEPFRIRVMAHDRRTLGAAFGVLSAFADLTYDTSLIDVNSTIAYQFADFTTGSVDDAGGLIDEAGGMKIAAPTVRGPQLVFQLDAIANAPGTLDVVPRAGTSLFSENQVFGVDGDIRGRTRYLPGSLNIGGVADLVPTAMNVVSDTVPLGRTTVDFNLENQGSAATGTFDVQIVHSNDDVAGNFDDVVIKTVTVAGLNAGETRAFSEAVQLDYAALLDRAIAEDSPNLGTTRTAATEEFLFLRIDPDNVVKELDDENNDGQGPGIDRDDFTFFPWDVDDNGIVNAADLAAVEAAFGQTVADSPLDVNGDGRVTPADAGMVANRLELRRNDAVVATQTARVAALTSPIARLVSVPTLSGPSGSGVATRPTFRWNAVSGASRYELWVRNDTIPRSPILNQRALTGTSFVSNIDLPNGDYRYWMRAFDADGVAGPWTSTPGRFSIGSSTAATVPGSLQGLTASALTGTKRPTIRWTAEASSARYEVWINNDTTGQVGYIRNPFVTGTTFTPAFDLPDGSYRVWVRGFNSAGQAGPFAAPASFSITTVATLAPDQPTMLAPFNAVTVNRPTFRWTAETGAARYDLWVNNDTTGHSQFIRNTNVTGTSFTPTFDLPDGDYRAFVRAVGADGKASDFSQPAGFTIGTITGAAPDLLGGGFNVEQDNVIAGKARVTFVVTNAGDAAADTFRVRIVHSNDNLIGNSEDLLVTEVEITGGLQPGESANRTVDLDLSVPTLFARAEDENPAGLGLGHVSDAADTLGMIIDADNVIVESDELNNGNQENRKDKDDITYFPWDIDGNEIVTPTDIGFIVNRLGQNTPAADARADVNGDGRVRSADVNSALDRVGYEINRTTIATLQANAGQTKTLPAEVGQAVESQTVESKTAESQSLASNDRTAPSPAVSSLIAGPARPPVAALESPAVASISVTFTDTSGNELAQLSPGDEFLINVRATDLRASGAGKGLFAAFADLLYDTNLIDVTGVDFGASGFRSFSTPPVIDDAAGTVDGAGGWNFAQPASRDAQLLFSLQATAVETGRLQVSTNVPEGDSSDAVLVGLDGDQRARVAFGGGSIRIVAPVEGPPEVSIGDSGNPARPLMNWTPVANASSYEVWVRNDTTGQSPVLHPTGLTTESYTPPSDLADGRYRVWVRAFNVDGEPGAWSQVFGQFTIDNDVPPPSQPVISSATPSGSGVTVNWAPASNASRYDVFLFRFDRRVRQLHTDITDESFTASNLPVGSYFATVRAYNSEGEASAFSQVVRFDIAPAALTAVDSALADTLRWTS